MNQISSRKDSSVGPAQRREMSVVESAWHDRTCTRVHYLKHLQCLHTPPLCTHAGVCMRVHTRAHLRWGASLLAGTGIRPPPPPGRPGGAAGAAGSWAQTPQGATCPLLLRTSMHPGFPSFASSRPLCSRRFCGGIGPGAHVSVLSSGVAGMVEAEGAALLLPQYAECCVQRAAQPIEPGTHMMASCLWKAGREAAAWPERARLGRSELNLATSCAAGVTMVLFDVAGRAVARQHACRVSRAPSETSPAAQRTGVATGPEL